ncbi:unnamed protein product [Cuscuta campestris]|uniref:F-box domain-containing protein n=1 Tax=Cuscuta campestris TaxID=132261 RepID=A0A484NPB5_9ASTE|nr:unnamed protein product [Cuscuta campestris]
MARATQLPWEIIVETLCRLPVKDLLRFRSVSKSWRSLIDSRDFIKLHLKHSPESTSHHRHLGLIFGGSNDLCWAALSDLNSFTRLAYPIDIGTGIVVVGCSHGLLALMNSKGDMAIWNPFTRNRRYINLPISEHTSCYPYQIFEVLLTGFGFDPVSDDYKFVLMIKYNGIIVQSTHLEVKVYSLKTRIWKKFDHFPDKYTYIRDNGLQFRDALHWLVDLNPEKSESILVFELGSEKFSQMSLPDYKGMESASLLRLVNLGGRFCAAMLQTVPNYDHLLEFSVRIDVWEMKEYGVKESWAKLFSVDASNAGGPFRSSVPVAYLQDDGGQVLLLQDGDKLLVFDVKRGRVKKRVGSGFPFICDAIVYAKSLVGLDFEETTWGQEGKKKGNDGKKKKKSGKKR